jgi:hypothetical protein
MNEIERIWALPPGTIYNEKEIDTVIKYYREAMGAIESGQKPKKNTAGDGLRLEDVITLEKPKSTFVRRV